MVKYGISGRPRILQMYNTKEHCGVFCKAVARNNMRVVMDRVHMRTSESTALNPSTSACCSNHNLVCGAQTSLILIHELSFSQFASSVGALNSLLIFAAI